MSTTAKKKPRHTRKDPATAPHHTKARMNRPESGAGRNPNNYPHNPDETPHAEFFHGKGLHQGRK